MNSRSQQDQQDAWSPAVSKNDASLSRPTYSRNNSNSSLPEFAATIKRQLQEEEEEHDLVKLEAYRKMNIPQDQSSVDPLPATDYTLDDEFDYSYQESVPCPIQVPLRNIPPRFSSLEHSSSSSVTSASTWIPSQPYYPSQPTLLSNAFTFQQARVSIQSTPLPVFPSRPTATTNASASATTTTTNASATNASSLESTRVDTTAFMIQTSTGIRWIAGTKPDLPKEITDVSLLSLDQRMYLTYKYRSKLEKTRLHIERIQTIQKQLVTLKQDMDFLDSLERLENIRKVQLMAIEQAKKQVENEKKHKQEASQLYFRHLEALKATKTREEEFMYKMLDTTLETRKSEKKCQEYAIELNQLKHVVESHKIKVQPFIPRLVTLLDQFQPRVMTLFYEMYEYLKYIYDAQQAVQKQISYLIECAEAKKRQLLLEDSARSESVVNRLIPWNNPNHKWDIEFQVKVTRMKPKKQMETPGAIFAAIQQKLPFQSICDLETVEMTLCAMLKPFGKGTFRSAYYAISPNDGSRFVIKHFHPGQGINEDECALCTSKSYFLCQLAGRAFSKELKRVGIKAQIDYVPSFLGRAQDARTAAVFGGKTLMMEPHINSFSKWTNNEKWVAEGSEGELMTAYSHFTYARSHRTLMITDHQGHRQVDQHGQEVFILTDPALHLTPPEGQYPILDEMSHPLDGNLRKGGVRAFARHHRCSQICVYMGLNPGRSKK